MLKRILLASATILCATAVGNIEIARTQKIIAHTHDQHGTTDHHHKMIEIPAGQPIPSVNLIVHKDPLKGYNLQTQVSNFRFAPENISNAAKPGEGHAHLYVNGKKITRLYGSWYYLENLQPGKNAIAVRLNSNNHQTLADNGKIIQDTETIEVPAPGN